MADPHVGGLLSSVADAMSSTISSIGEAGVDASVRDAVTGAGDAVSATADVVSAAGEATKEAVQSAGSAAQTTMQSPGWLKPWTDLLEKVLGKTESTLAKAGVPYSYGWSILLLVLFVKTLTFPLTKQQVQSSLKTQRLRPMIQDIKDRYPRNPEIIERETQVLQEEYDVNPSAGLLPSLASIPIFLGLFYSLRNVASEGLLDDQGFFFIPTLGGPTSFAARQAGSSLQWLWPFVDGHPPIGWDEAIRYLILPIGVVIAQILSSQILTPNAEGDDKSLLAPDDSPTLFFNTQYYNESDPKAQGLSTAEAEKEDKKKESEEFSKKFGKVLGLLLPLLVGYFSLNVPSGLALYYFSNTLISSAQQIYLRNLGGAELDEIDTGEIPDGYGIRTGEFVDPLDGDLSEDYFPDWVKQAQEGNVSAITDWKDVLGYDPKAMKAPTLYTWIDELAPSEFSDEIENLQVNQDDPYPEFNQIIETGKTPTEYDDFFQDPDVI